MSKNFRHESCSDFVGKYGNFFFNFPPSHSARVVCLPLLGRFTLSSVFVFYTIYIVYEDLVFGFY